MYAASNQRLEDRKAKLDKLIQKVEGIHTQVCVFQASPHLYLEDAPIWTWD